MLDVCWHTCPVWVICLSFYTFFLQSQEATLWAACCAILSDLLTLLIAGGWPVSCYVVRLAGGVVALPWHLLGAAAEKNQVPPTTSCSSHTRWWSRLQRCPLAQPNHAGKKKGPRQVSLLKKVLITPLIWVLQAPTMASLAKQGVILEQNYVQPKCAPSRAALMTGETWHPSNLAG